MPTWVIEYSKQHTWVFKAAYITSLYFGALWVKILQYMDISVILLSESLLYELGEFLNLFTNGWEPRFISLLLCHDRCQWTKEWELYFARKCLSRKWGIKQGKINQALQLVGFFKRRKMIGCDTKTRKCQFYRSSQKYTSISMKMTLLVFYFIYIFWRNDFITGTTA